MATFKPVIFKGKDHIKSDGTTNINIRVYHRKISQYISTPYYIPPEHMLESGGISPLHPNADTLDYEIGELIQKHKGNFIKLGTNRTSKMSCTELRDILISMSEPQSDFIDFVDFSKKVVEGTKKKKTASWYDNSINSFKKFWKSEKINACDVMANRIREYKEYLEKNDQEPGGISNYMRGIRSLYNKCKKHYNKEDYNIILIPNEPFKGVDIPEYKRKKKNVPVDIVRKIRDGHFDTDWENIGQDMFMIMFYLMGINVNDLFNLKEPKYGRIEYERSKTDTDGNTHMYPLSIKVEPELQKLFDKYSSGYFFSDIKTRYANSYNFMRAINKGLKMISEKLDIPKITSNWARHSWASIARNKAKVSKADVDFCLGHVNNDYKMADIYIEIDYSIYDKTNRKVLRLLSGEKKEKKKMMKKKNKLKKMEKKFAS